MKKIVLVTAGILLIAAVIALAQEANVVPAGSIVQAIKEYVVKNVGCAESDLLIEYKTPLVDEKIPEGVVSIEIKSGANTKFSGFTTFEVFILLDNKVYKSFVMYVEIDNKVKAYMAGRWIKRYEPMSLENVSVIDTYRSKIPLDALSVDEELVGKVAKTALAKGKIITRSSIETPPLIKSNDMVDIILLNKNIKVNAKGTALMDARKDETIKVRLLDSRKDIYGKVVDSSTVYVETAR